MLKSHEILARGSVLGNSRGKGVLVIGTPCVFGEVTTLVADARLANLEPVAGAIVALNVASRSLGHVVQGGSCKNRGSVNAPWENFQRIARAALTRMLHGGTNAKLHSHVASRGDLEDVRLGGVGKGSLVASAVGAVDVGVVTNVFGRVLRPFDRVVLGSTSEVPDVLERSSCHTVFDDGIEEVVGRGHLGKGKDSSGRKSHVDGWLPRYLCRMKRMLQVY